MNWLAIFKKQIEPRLVSGENGCILFTGVCNPDGRGKVKIGGRKGYTEYVYRIVFAAFKGEIPAGTLIRHSCHNPKCCNIEHLKAGSQADNIQDMILAKRGNYPTGESGILGVSPQRDRGYFYWLARAKSDGETLLLYRGKDFFEACCARKSWEARQ